MGEPTIVPIQTSYIDAFTNKDDVANVNKGFMFYNGHETEGLKFINGSYIKDLSTNIIHSSMIPFSEESFTTTLEDTTIISVTPGICFIDGVLIETTESVTLDAADLNSYIYSATGDGPPLTDGIHYIYSIVKYDQAFNSDAFVGLIGDIDYLGSNYISNGLFNSDAVGWTSVNSNLTSTSRYGRTTLKVEQINGTSNGYANQTITGLDILSKYRFHFLHQSGTADGMVEIGYSDTTGDIGVWSVSNVSGYGSPSTTGWGYNQVLFTPTNATVYVSLSSTGSSALDTTYFDNVKLEKLPNDYLILDVLQVTVSSGLVISIDSILNNDPNNLDLKVRPNPHNLIDAGWVKDVPDPGSIIT